MRRYLPVLSLFTLLACQDKIICPAFQSTYILDDSTRNAYYSYVWQLDEATRTQYLAGMNNSGENDSLGVVAQPKTDYYAYAGEKVVPWRVRGRTKYGIVKYEPYWLKKYRMRTAPMENVYGPEPVENNLVASDFADSLTVDSLAIASLDSIEVLPVASGKKEEPETKYLYKYDPTDNFNVEQEYYNKYFGKNLVDNRPEPQPKPQVTQEADSLASALPDSLQQKKSPFKGLFKKKKNKADTTSTAPVAEPEDTGNE
ncbi:MAG: hypothetical protein RIM99_09305 [Cyclobacteriaceae bacterium]